jgi:hypothetical protein
VLTLLAMLVGTHTVSAQTAPSPPASSRVTPAGDTAVPLTAAIWVPGPTGLTEVLPGTADYYDLRIRNRFYLEAERLKAGEPLRGRILQRVDDLHVRVRGQALRQEGSPGASYSAWVDDEDYLVTVPPATSTAIGHTVEWLLEPGPGATCRMADGKELRMRGGRKVEGVTLDQYRAVANRAPAAPNPEPAVVSYQALPTAAESAARFREDVARFRATPEGQRIAREVAEERRQRAARETPPPAADAARGPRIVGTVTPILPAAVPSPAPAVPEPERTPK